MGANNADISRSMYNEGKEYHQLIYQQGTPPVDADFNDSQQIVYHLLRRFIQRIIGDGTSDNGFKIVGSGLWNNFTIKGGGGTVESSGNIVVDGRQCILLSDLEYEDETNLELTPVSTGITATVLSDSAANFTFGGADDNLAGRVLMPDITSPLKIFTIVANTQTTITISGDMLSFDIEVGDHYIVQLSTPSGGDRTDEVYLDCYLSEISGDDDEDIKHVLGVQIETARRFKMIHTIQVVQGGVTPNSIFIDADGNEHSILKIATIERYDGINAIEAVDITDNRPLIQGTLAYLWNEIVTARGVEADLNTRITRLIDPGTRMAFFQAAAPYGWTQDLSHNDKMLRVVSGAGGGSGGSDSPISHYHAGGDHTLTESEMPSHRHSMNHHSTTIDEGDDSGKGYEVPGGTSYTTYTGGGNAHNHGDSNTYSPKYINMILCTKD